MTCERRQFLRTAAAVGAVAAGVACGKPVPKPPEKTAETPAPPPDPMTPPAREPAPPGPKPAAGPRSKVVQVTNPKVYDAQGKLVPATVQEMVDRAVMELSGKSTAREAWSTYFSPSEKVGLKPNMLGREVCWTNPEVVAAIVNGLRSAGVRDENMYLWDLKAFDISPLFTAFKGTKINVKTTMDWGFGDTRYKIDSGPPTRLVKPLLEVDAVVNIPLIKDHGLAGVTCAIKSILGSIDNPPDHHTNPRKEKTCDPMIAELSALPEVRKKMRLILTDANQIIIEGGPRGVLANRRTLSSVFAATDPVAMDRVAWTIIDAQRRLSKLVPLMERPLGPDGPRGRPLHVLTAQKLGLGTADPAQIDHVIKTLG
jgi:uncharacterized protein (DUF362 family)